MLCTKNIYMKKRVLLVILGAKKYGRTLSTGLNKALESDVNPILLPFHHVEKECVITTRDLLVPKFDELKESLLSLARMVNNRLESIDYAVLITSGLHRTRLILSTVRLAASDTPSSSADKVTGGTNTSREEIYKKWAVIKEKLPAWQDDIADKLQRLQDYVNKKINNMNGKKE